jgi:hypothetical protein
VVSASSARLVVEVRHACLHRLAAPGVSGSDYQKALTAMFRKDLT